MMLIFYFLNFNFNYLIEFFLFILLPFLNIHIYNQIKLYKASLNNFFQLQIAQLLSYHYKDKFIKKFWS
jgi:hypothetical protein